MTAPDPPRVRFADCYVLAHRRTREFIMAFLDQFLPRREEYTDEYEVPQFAEHPVIVFQTAGQLLDYLEHAPHTVHAVYWYNPQEEQLRAAMCLFTSDGQVIVGLTCESHYPDDHIEQGYLQALMDYCRSPVGLIEYEKPAPKDTADLLRRIAARAKGEDYPV